jgi:hypothetical protein
MSMDITSVSSNVSQLTDILKQAAASHGDLAQNLMRVAAQQSVDRNKLETIAQVVDLYA